VDDGELLSVAAKVSGVRARLEAINDDQFGNYPDLSGELDYEVQALAEVVERLAGSVSDNGDTAADPDRSVTLDDDSAAASKQLEPAAWEHIYRRGTSKPLAFKDDPASVDAEPLVRASDLRERTRRLREEHCDCGLSADLCSVCEALEELRGELEAAAGEGGGAE
jgi:hypothetical protein